MGNLEGNLKSLKMKVNLGVRNIKKYRNCKVIKNQDQKLGRNVKKI